MGGMGGVFMALMMGCWFCRISATVKAGSPDLIWMACRPLLVADAINSVCLARCNNNKTHNKK